MPGSGSLIEKIQRRETGKGISKEGSKEVRLWEQRGEGSNPFAPTNKPVATSTLATPGSPVTQVTGLFALGQMSRDVLVSPMFHPAESKFGS